MKRLLFRNLDFLIRFLLLPFSLIKVYVWKKIIFIILFLITRANNDKNATKIMLATHSLSYRFASSSSKRFFKGSHPKQNIIKYQDFFKNHLSKNDSVLDIGCGSGFLASECGGLVKYWYGIDIDNENIKITESKYKFQNGNFKNISIEDLKIDKKFDKVVLSNVLEHIKYRISILKKINSLLNKKGTLLIRVPALDRDWTVIMKKNLGEEYLSDKTHFLEYTEEILIDELSNSGFRILDLKSKWGEYYVVATHKET